MKLLKSEITELLKMQKRVAELYENGRVISVDPGSIQMGARTFKETFPDYETTQRASEEYPFNFHHMHRGVKFFAIAATEDEGEE